MHSRETIKIKQQARAHENPRLDWSNLILCSVLCFEF